MKLPLGELQALLDLRVLALLEELHVLSKDGDSRSWGVAGKRGLDEEALAKIGATGTCGLEAAHEVHGLVDFLLGRFWGQ